MRARVERGRVTIPVIVGPTAAGKSAVALNVASRLGAEIVSADSRQVYKFMDIGTAKPTLEERALVPHHLIDIRQPDEYYSAGEYARDAAAAVAGILARGRFPIVVGGSGFYIKALVDGLFGPKVADPALRARLRQEAQDLGVQALWQRLADVDPVSAACLHPNDAQRIIRALEVYESTGVPISLHQARHRPEPSFGWHFLGLRWPRQELYARIERRVDEMMAEGLEQEVRQLLALGYDERLVSLRTVGYKEMFAFIRGELSLEEAVVQIKQHTRNYAKRQMTWFRRDARVGWVDVNEAEGLAQAERQVEEIIARYIGEFSS
ncbi:MAG: tRNA (adenosine(37)-N6)-dimethylallyltransferase MiaA [bacterium]|jgi:tRNA dimethylallyltransferase|nr:tRNA (adenosine(37)-N6)-dimethylallyltransferase MiaA [candidate division KSB1 bacterium]MDH7560063.1 tRNA (adenosine(37)-N6)-dimethylallyltransferase MiaA [bacterium]